MRRDNLREDEVRPNAWRRISPTERANAIVWLQTFEPKDRKEERAKKIMTYFFVDNISASAIARKRDPDIVGFGNRSHGLPLSAGSILQIIYDYFPQLQGRMSNSTEGNKRVEKIRKREKQASPHIKQCAFCGNQNNLEEHHMIPLYLGGTNDDRNLVFLCHDCHKTVSNYQTKLRRRNDQQMVGDKLRHGGRYEHGFDV